MRGRFGHGQHAENWCLAYSCLEYRTIKLEPIPNANIRQDGGYLLLPANPPTVVGLAYRIRLNPTSWRKATPQARECSNPYLLIIKGKLEPSTAGLDVVEAGIQFVERLPKEEKEAC